MEKIPHFSRAIYVRAWVSRSKFRGHLNLFEDSVANGMVAENNMKNESSAVETDFFISRHRE